MPLVEFMYLVLTRLPGGVTVGDSGLRCCVPFLSSATISLCLLIIDAWFQYEATCSFFAESGQKLPPEFYYRNAYSTKFNSKKKRLLINLANFVKIIMEEL